MTTVQAIAQHIEALPADARREVLDFVEFLEFRARPSSRDEGDAAWSLFSLASAVRGMEDESSPYTTADLKETFR
jgi:hypothetical protein